jgi:DNA polymerase II small subunit/DNA polymerase delta subunit B
LISIGISLFNLAWRIALREVKAPWKIKESENEKKKKIKIKIKKMNEMDLGSDNGNLKTMLNEAFEKLREVLHIRLERRNISKPKKKKVKIFFIIIRR